MEVLQKFYLQKLLLSQWYSYRQGDWTPRHTALRSDKHWACVNTRSKTDHMTQMHNLEASLEVQEN